jgi:hypothetical protein
MAQEIREVVFRVQVDADNGRVQVEGLTKGFVKAETAFKKMQTQLAQTNEAMKGAGISTGLANTAILEFGRTVSDAPYGIQGMGNNITQLVTILGQMSQAAKEGGSVLKSLRTAFMGPLGIVIAVQVAIAAFELFRKSQSKAKKETESMTEAIAKSGVELRLSLDVLESENVTLEEKNSVLAKLNEKYPEWNLQNSKSGEISEENKNKILEEIEAVENLAKARALQSVLEGLYAERAKMLAERAPDEDSDGEGFFTGARDRFNRMLASTGFYGSEAEQKAFDKSLSDIDKKVNAVVGEFTEDPALLNALLGTDKNKKLKKESRDRVKTLAVEVMDTTFGQLEERKKITKDRLERLGIDIPTLLTGGEEGIQKTKDGILALGEALPKDNKFAERMKETMRKAIFPEDILDGLDTLLDSASGLVDAQAERDLAIEQNKTNALNDQLKQRLANEQLSAQERDKINQQISRNEAALVARENEINKKRFEQQKALQLASATAELYRTAFLAYGSQLVIGDPTSPIRAQIAQGIALAAGLANIAMIAKQKFTGKAMPSPNLVAQGGGAPAESQGPAFNLIGSGGQSQLAAAIASQQQSPVRAYVVSGDVTTAQSLERNKIQEASI